MFDARLRHVKDGLIAPLCAVTSRYLTPLQVTFLGFLWGLIGCALAARGWVILSTTFWLLNRVFDCLDGAVARACRKQSDLGGFLDLLADFIVYSLIPISCALGQSAPNSTRGAADVQLDLIVVSLLEASFYINNFVLFYIGAVLEKMKSAGNKTTVEELTSIAMRPALIEGFESGVFFTAMLSLPSRVRDISIVMLLGVLLGTAQRVSWIVPVLSRQQHRAGIS